MVTIKPLNKNKEEIELKPEPVVEKKETTVKPENTTAKTDSKKEEFELRNHVKKLDDQINDFYELCEWKGDYYGSI